MMNYRMFSTAAFAFAIAIVLSGTSAFADDPADASDRNTALAAPGEVAIPTCLEKLTLTQPQQEQIKQIVREYDADLALVWKQFGTRYLETVRTEALLLTAIEDNLTEAQRKQVRDQRRKTAQHQKSLAGTDEKPNQATTKPSGAVEEEIGIVGVPLTAEQEAAADKLQEKCLGRLRSLNRDIQGLHIRLVSLEADKLVEIENVLTPEQLRQLRENRQNAPIELKVSTKATTPAKSR
jgi:Spy/CpxP family protein refolding chaperone